MEGKSSGIHHCSLRPVPNSLRGLFPATIIFFAYLFIQGCSPKTRICTYTVYNWNVNKKMAVNFRTVRRPYRELSSDEIGATGCTVCSEDQKLINIPPLEPFRVCRKMATKIRKTLQRLVDEGEPIFEMAGYRVGRTRNPVDGQGNRMGFSNHSYGIAIDINPELNGLYDNCVEFGPHCRLIRGDHWRPGVPGSIEPNGRIVEAMESIGLKWGGEIEGKQKDFMHFSPTGY